MSPSSSRTSAAGSTRESVEVVKPSAGMSSTPTSSSRQPSSLFCLPRRRAAQPGEHKPTSGDKKIASARVAESAVEEAKALDVEVDAVFGVLKKRGPNYRAVGWLGASVLMMKTQIGLGVLSIPFVLSTLGVVPGIICLLAIAIITTWSDFVVGQFKLRHPEVYSIDDVGMLMGGKVGREAIGVAFWLFLTLIAGSGMLGISIALNAISSHGTCTAVFVAVAAIVTFILASVRTLGKISWISWIGVGSILAAVVTLAVAVGVQDRPDAAPQTGDWHKQINIVNDPTFYEAVSAITALIFSFAGTPTFFGIVSEMRQPKLYTRSMLLCQTSITCIYLAIGIVVYFFAGQYVSSPALGSAGIVMKKVCYGLALPGLCATATIASHLPAKWMFVRALRGSKHLISNSVTHWAVWLSCVLSCVVFSYIIASAVPAFGGLVGIIGALFGTIMTMQIMGCMWLYDNWERRKTDSSLGYRLELAWAIFVIIIGSFLMVAGTYGSVLDIKSSLEANGGSKPWSCADNSL